MQVGEIYTNIMTTTQHNTKQHNSVINFLKQQCSPLLKNFIIHGLCVSLNVP